ncbi:hypothetical protein D3C80_1937970 [compost metagenome]
MQEVCRAGETEDCKKVRLTETGGFVGSVGLGTLASTGAGLAAGTMCAAFAVGTAGLGVSVCGIVLVGAGGLAGGLAGGKIGESAGEFIYEATSD